MEKVIKRCKRNQVQPLIVLEFMQRFMAVLIDHYAPSSDITTSFMQLLDEMLDYGTYPWNMEIDNVKDSLPLPSFLGKWSELM
jgi:superfamily I DNA/RNA helicase